MTVRELIKSLSALDPDTEVVVTDAEEQLKLLTSGIRKPSLVPLVGVKAGQMQRGVPDQNGDWDSGWNWYWELDERGLGKDMAAVNVVRLSAAR